MVMQGLQPMTESPHETTTRGLENLAANAKAYHSQGARFAKWRAALRIADGLPSEAAVSTADPLLTSAYSHYGCQPACRRLSMLDLLAAGQNHHHGHETLPSWCACALPSLADAHMQVEANAQQLAQYAATCQAAGLVPIVEPEILIEGDHDIATAAAVSARVICRCVARLWQQVAPKPHRAAPQGTMCSKAPCRPLHRVHVAPSG
jgi:fructose-bisphosphate aldolase class 1